MTTSEIKISAIVGQGYEEFWNCKKRYRVLKGGKGSKKSATTALNFIFRLMKEKESKQKFALYIQDSVLDIARALYEQDNCRSVSEFICKAIKFYGGYVANTNMNPDYVPQVVLSTLKSIMHDSENRHNGSLFRIAVEISMIKNLLAIRQGISDVPLNKLRNDCITEVKKINGTISYEDAIRWQL